MAATPFFGLLSLLFVAGACLLHFFVLLAGAVGGTPTDFIYFLQADTTGIPNAPGGATRWTFWNAYAVDSYGNTIITDHHPAYPLDPPRNFMGADGNYQTVNIPAGFEGTNYYYYMTRFMFAFNLIALFFAVCALFTGLAAICSRIGSYISSFFTFIALVFEILFAVLMTVAYVKGRDLFQGAGRDAQVGQYAFGFIWAAVAQLILATVLFCMGGAFSKSAEYGGSNSRRFGRKRSTRSRGSFIDTDSQRPVVQEV